MKILNYDRLHKVFHILGAGADQTVDRDSDNGGHGQRDDGGRRRDGQAVTEALKMSNWVQKDAADLLGISPRVMNYKIKILGIEIPRSRRQVHDPVTV